MQLTPDMLTAAKASARNNARPLIEEIAAVSGISEREALLAVAEAFDLETISADEMRDWEVATAVVALPVLIRRRCLLFRCDGQFKAAIADPFDSDAQQWLLTLASTPIEILLALPSDIQAMSARAERSATAIEQVRGSSTFRNQQRERSDIEELSLQSISEDSSPVVRLLNSTLYDALKAGASDVHLESSALGMSIRYRIDGVLETITAVEDTNTAEQVISRIKVMAELDIAERRIPQDGRFRVNFDRHDVDIRVSVMPSVHGEDAVLRILDKRNFLSEGKELRLEALGFDESSLVTIRRLAREPYGMLLVTGPTGSGKTTTLYAGISEINHGRDKIVTIEDPVEYDLPGVLQIPVNEKKGLTFARGLRSILRHDPDKIMVGEIRDRDTAEIAVQSALTGHLVLTTVHANNVFDVFNRFTHMGIDVYALTSALNGIWAQRLLRVICPNCSERHRPTELELREFGLRPEESAGLEFRRGAGCGECRSSGYRGRKAIAEILVLNDNLRQMIATRASVADIKAAARANGTRSLRESALDLLARGETTLEEIGRVTLSL